MLRGRDIFHAFTRAVRVWLSVQVEARFNTAEMPLRSRSDAHPANLLQADIKGPHLTVRRTIGQVANYFPFPNPNPNLC